MIGIKEGHNQKKKIASCILFQKDLLKTRLRLKQDCCVQ